MSKNNELIKHSSIELKRCSTLFVYVVHFSVKINLHIYNIKFVVNDYMSFFLIRKTNRKTSSTFTCIISSMCKLLVTYVRYHVTNVNYSFYLGNLVNKIILCICCNLQVIGNRVYIMFGCVYNLIYYVYMYLFGGGCGWLRNVNYTLI